MNPPPPELFSGGSDNRPSPRRELQGPRPAALKVNKDSHKIRKPPVAPPPHHRPPSQPPPDDRQPVIIYAVSPKVIHTTVSDFMNLVQRLTGNTAADDGGHLSPAARLASIEKTSSPASKDRENIAGNSVAGGNDDSDFMGDILWDTDVELERFPGILSPAPASMAPISPGFFSPSVDPFMMGLGYNNMFVPSPSTLFSAPMVSPSSSCDLFNSFFDF